MPDLDWRDLFRRLPQAVCVVRLPAWPAQALDDVRVVDANPAFAALTGVAPAEGRALRELFPQLESVWAGIVEAGERGATTARVVSAPVSASGALEVEAWRFGAAEQRLLALRLAPGPTQPTERTGDTAGAGRDDDARFHRIADAAPAMLWVTETDGRCSYLSRGWYEYTGQTSEQGLDYGWLDAVHPGDRDGARIAFVDANAAQAAFALEHRLRRADGVYRWVIDAGRPWYRDDGVFGGYVGSVIDIHDRKRAEDRLDLAVNSGRVGLWYCDLPFDVLVWNTQVKEHFGLPPDATVTIETFFERIHPEDREPTRVAIETAIGQQSSYDTRYRTIGLDGRLRWIRALGRARYQNGVPVHFDGITVDVTELVTLRESAEAANRAKDEFFAMLGHELRNPLAPILTALQLIKLRGIDGIERERTVIERQAKHLVGLVDDLLDVSRIGRAQVQLRTAEVDLADVVGQAVEVVGPLLEQRQHALSVDVPRGLVIEGDRERLAQVVGNLLSNAVKFTEPHGRITIAAHGDASAIALSVSDSGTGIDAAILPRIFDLFVQGRQTLERAKGGLGLGLAIVRSLVELHGGTVHAASAGPGAGATFTIRLPRRADERGSAPSPAVHAASPAARQHDRAVLVVDDNADAATLLGTLLTALGCEVRVAHDGPAALVVCERFHPDVALIDIGLPVMDGLELARRLRERKSLARTRLVAVTGYGQDRDRAASHAAGFSAHLVKPVDPDALSAVLDEP